MADRSKWLQFGNIRAGKEEGTFYIKITEDINLKAGENISVRTPEEGIKGLLEKGFIDETQAEERIAKVPEYIRYELLAKPLKD